MPALSQYGTEIHFVQDAFHVGFTERRNKQNQQAQYLPITARFDPKWEPFDEYSLKTLTTTNFGYYDLKLPSDGTYNMGGNVIAMPPDATRKYGSVIYGKGINAKFEKFIDRQTVIPRCDVDLSAMNLGHIDEFISVVPGAILVADFRLARKILTDINNQKIATEHGIMTIKQLADKYLPNDQTIIQMEKAVDTALATVQPYFPVDFRIVRIPVFLEVPGSQRESCIRPPNSINSLVINEKVYMPDPCWQPLRDTINATIPGTTFVNTVYYSKRGGELHCATNAIRQRQEKAKP